MIKKYADLHYACAPHRPNVESRYFLARTLSMIRNLQMIPPWNVFSTAFVLIFLVFDSEERGDVRGWWFTKADSQFSSRDVTDLAIGFDDSVEYLVKVNAFYFRLVLSLLWAFWAYGASVVVNQLNPNVLSYF